MSASILLTGATGYIGGRLLRSLEEGGHAVRCLARQPARVRPTSATTEVVAGYYMVAIAYLPWAFVARNDNHIVAGIFKQIGTPTFDYWVEIGVKILTTTYVAIFTYQTFLAALQRTSAGEVWLAGTKYLPVWPTRWLLPLAGSLMIAHLVLRVLADLARGRGDSERNGTASPT